MCLFYHHLGANVSCSAVSALCHERRQANIESSLVLDILCINNEDRSDLS